MSGMSATGGGARGPASRWAAALALVLAPLASLASGCLSLGSDSAAPDQAKRSGVVDDRVTGEPKGLPLPKPDPVAAVVPPPPPEEPPAVAPPSPPGAALTADSSPPPVEAPHDDPPAPPEPPPAVSPAAAVASSPAASPAPRAHRRAQPRPRPGSESVRSAVGDEEAGHGSLIGELGAGSVVSGRGGGGAGGGGLGGGGLGGGGGGPIGLGGRRAPAGSTLVLRAGARRLRALYRRDYYAECEPEPGLQLPALKEALQGRRPRAAIRPFTQRPAASDDEAFDVERAGEIVAVAIARQLEELRWEVGLDADASVLPIATDEFPAVDVTGHPLAFRFSGRVRFWVRASAGEGPAGHTATLDGQVRVRSLRSSGTAVIYARSHTAEATVTEEQEAVRGVRARKAAAAALRRWVRALFTDLRERGTFAKEAQRR